MYQQNHHRSTVTNLAALAAVLFVLSIAGLIAGCATGASAGSTGGATPTPTPVGNGSPTPTPTPAPSATPTPTPGPSATPTPTPAPSATPTPTPIPPTGGANSWSNRSQGINVPGGGASVLSTQSFDIFPPVTKQEYFQLYDPQSITTDCTQAADGCSLKWSILVGYPQGEPGWFDWNFSPDLTKTFGAGQEFYVQYRERLDPGMLNGANFPNGEGFKHDIITEGDTNTVQAGDCSNSPGEVVTIQDGNGAPYPSLYHNCGFSGGTLDFMQSGYQLIQLPGIVNTNFLDEDASGCPHYSGRGVPTTDPTCFNYAANEWFTVQVHVKVGAFGSPNSVLEMWLAHQGQPARLIVNAADAALVNDGTGGASGKYGKIQLSAYNTSMSGSLVNTAVWFDDLMASTRRIPDPNVATPNPPDSLHLSGIGSTGVTVNWRVNSQNGTPEDDAGFQVERCTGTPATCFPGPQSGFTKITTTIAGASSFLDTSVVSGTTYTYRVRATNSAGASAYSEAICFNGGTTCGGTVVVP